MAAYEETKNAFLLVNLTDLDYLRMPVFGSALSLMIREDLGDRLHPGAYMRIAGRVDDVVVVVEATPERATAIKDALELIGERKIGRKIRTEIRTGLPTGKNWRYVQGG
jgi:hypothetical protein